MEINSDNNFGNEEIIEQEQDVREEILQKRSNKRIYTIAAVAASVIILAVIFVFAEFKVIDVNMYTKYTSSSSENISGDDIKGVFTDKTNGMYFDFLPKETKAEHKEEISADSAASSDGAEPVIKTVTYDGTCESGYTDEYVNEVLARIYVEQNNLNEDYETYLDKKGTVLNDYTGYINTRGVDKSELDDIDATNSISQEAKSYSQKCYWNFNGKTGEITVYDINGKKLSVFKISGNNLVAANGYFKGKTFKDEKFNSSYTYSEDGYSETFYFYDDGKFIVKSAPSGETPQYYAGEYEGDENYVSIKVNGEKMIYKKLSEGLSSITLQK